MLTAYTSLQFLRLLGMAFIINFVTASNEDSHVIRVAPMFDIIPTDPNNPTTLGEVGGLRQCGGPGKAVAIRYYYCDGEYPCKVPGDGENRPAALEFIPSRDIDALGVRGTSIWEGGAQIVVDRPLANSTVRAGQSYFCNGGGSAKKELIGKKFTYQWLLYRVDDGQVELCGEVDFEVVEP